MVKVILTGDWHIGLEGALDSDLIYDVAGSYWAGKPVLLMGDLIDMGLDRGMNFSNKTHPGAQVMEAERICELLDVKGYVLGNHERRVFRTAGLNPYELFLGKEKDFVTIDYVNFFIYHGRGNAMDIFSEHRKMMLFMDADVYSMGHNHQLAKREVLRGNGLCDFSRITLLRTGSFVDWPDYAHRGGFAPAMSGWVEYDTVKLKAQLYRVFRNGTVKKV